MPSKLQFNTQITRRQPIRTSPTKFLSSKLRPHIERSEGERLSEAFMPYKCLPVMFIDVETSDGVVIQKGTIVSLLTNQTNATTTPSGISEIASSGTIPVFEDALARSSSIVGVNVDNSFFGYQEGIAALLVPCNGGIQSRIPYSADDATLGTFTCSGKVVTAAMGANPESNFCLLEANMPIGVAQYDIYQDIRGQHLNYDLWGMWTVLCDFYIEVPYVDKYLASTFASGYVNAIDRHIYNLNATTCAGYLATWKKYPFFYFTSDSSYTDGAAGMNVVSDMYGKFMPQPDSGTSVARTLTTQTVGKLILTDSRYPKDYLEMVDTYPGSQMPGTETGGLPSMLWNFVRDAYYGMNGAYPTIDQAVNLVQNGHFGIARIQLNI